MKFFSALTVTLLLVSATSHADTAAPTAADIQQFLAFFDQLVDIAIANQDDCGKDAAAVNGHIDANKAMLDKAHAATASGKKLPKDAQDHMMTATQKLMPVFQKCGKNESFKAAFQRLDLKHG